MKKLLLLASMLLSVVLLSYVECGMKMGLSRSAVSLTKVIPLYRTVHTFTGLSTCATALTTIAHQKRVGIFRAKTNNYRAHQSSQGSWTKKIVAAVALGAAASGFSCADDKKEYTHKDNLLALVFPSFGAIRDMPMGMVTGTAESYFKDLFVKDCRTIYQELDPEKEFEGFDSVHDDSLHTLYYKVEKYSGDNNEKSSSIIVHYLDFFSTITIAMQKARDFDRQSAPQKVIAEYTKDLKKLVALVRKTEIAYIDNPVTQKTLGAFLLAAVNKASMKTLPGEDRIKEALTYQLLSPVMEFEQTYKKFIEEFEPLANDKKV